MSWNRTKYDGCAYQKELSQSTSPINYTLDGNKFYNNHECRPSFGLLAGNNVSITRENVVDLESDLFGITRQASSCPERKYLPHCDECGSDLAGICGSKDGCKLAKSLQHLPECAIIEYAPKINHIGYDIKYPASATQSVGGQKMIYPPQINPTQRFIKGM